MLLYRWWYCTYGPSAEASGLAACYILGMVNKQGFARPELALAGSSGATRRNFE